MNEIRMKYMEPMKSIKLYVPDTQELILAVEGTGDNLLDEDEEQGYVDYIMATVYRIDGEQIEEVDGGQIMLKKLVADMTHEEFRAKVLDYFCYDPEAKTIKEL